MLLNSPDMRPTDKYLHNLLQESYKGESKHKILKLPCNCTSIELSKPEDVRGVCPVCYKPFYLVWSKVAPKLRGTGL